MAKKRSNGEGTLGKTVRNGKEYFRYTITIGYDADGKQIRKQFYGKKEKEAKEKYNDWKKKQGYASNDKSTLASHFHYWLFEVRKMELKASTFERYYGIYKNYILTNTKLANSKLTEITTQQMQIHYNTLIKNDLPVSRVKTINRYIKTFFEDCYKEGLIARNPCNTVKFPKENTINEDNEDQFIHLTEEEQQKLAIALHKDDLELVILLGLTCGMRLGEILALNYNDFDFNDNWININKSLKRVAEIDNSGKRVYRYQVMTPKTKNSVRKSPLPQFLIPMIKQLNKQNLQNKINKGELYCDTGLLFCDDFGNPIDSKKPNRRLKSIAKKIGINDDIKFHSLRSIFISNCVNKDINPKTVQSWVGHSDINVTLNVYSKVSKDKLQESSQLINSIFVPISK